MIPREVFCAVQLGRCHSVWRVVMTADDKWLPDAGVKHHRSGCSSSYSPVSTATPQLLTLSDPFSNPIPFPAASCPEWLFWLTPFMEHGGRGRGYECVYWVCQLRYINVCLSVCWDVFLQESVQCTMCSCDFVLCFGSLCVCRFFFYIRFDFVSERFPWQNKHRHQLKLLHCRF